MEFSAVEARPTAASAPTVLPPTLGLIEMQQGE
jgi:hypothetical protein